MAAKNSPKANSNNGQNSDTVKKVKAGGANASTGPKSSAPLDSGERAPSGKSSAKPAAKQVANSLVTVKDNKAKAAKGKAPTGEDTRTAAATGLDKGAAKGTKAKTGELISKPVTAAKAANKKIAKNAGAGAIESAQSKQGSKIVPNGDKQGTAIAKNNKGTPKGQAQHGKKPGGLGAGPVGEASKDVKTLPAAKQPVRRAPKLASVPEAAEIPGATEGSSPSKSSVNVTSVAGTPSKARSGSSKSAPAPKVAGNSNKGNPPVVALPDSDSAEMPPANENAEQAKKASKNASELARTVTGQGSENEQQPKQKEKPFAPSAVNREAVGTPGVPLAVPSRVVAPPTSKTDVKKAPDKDIYSAATGTSSSSPMPARELDKFRGMLQELRAETVSELEVLSEQLREMTSSENVDDNSAYSLHMAEQGTDAMEREKTFLQAQRTNDYIKKLDEALNRINDNTFGLCRICGLRLDSKRLMAVPVTQVCTVYKNTAKPCEPGRIRMEKMGVKESETSS